MDSLTTVAVIFSYVLSLLRISMALDTIIVNQPITDGETITSAGGSFELGFFNPGNSKNRYLGIWYKKASKKPVVWVANRESPLTDSSGVLKVTQPGILVLVNGTNGILWNSTSSRSAQDPNAQLLDSGNLIMRNGNDSDPENSLWQSFDYPCDTLLPGMKFGWNRVTGLDRHLSSWRSADDPSKGNFTYGIDLSGFPQLLLKNGLAVAFRPGPWNGIRFSGIPQLTINPVYSYEFVSNEKEIYFMYHLVNSSVVMRNVLTPDGYSRRFTWTDQKNEWSLYSTAQRDDCDTYAICGVNGICKINESPKCECMKGFRPKIQSNWDMADWSNGCIRSTRLDCQKGDGFEKYSGVKLPDTQSSWFNESMNLKECASLCLSNCSCTAYANSDIRGAGSGCLLWFGGLIDIRDFTQNGQEFYVRMAASELASSSINSSSKKKRKQVIVISISIIGIVLLSLVLSLYVLKKRKKQLKRKGYMDHNSEGGENNEGQEHLELPLFDLDTLLNATNNFSSDSKLGEGGFGPVYKGILQERQEIAVKMMSKTSRQGFKEFKNEVESIAKLQHRNLVKLLGCCIHGRERMLIYEYMPNKSLDLLIFDQKRSKVLDWPKRFLIIIGIARGLLYLHQDSRLRIIHRDVKAENILLDIEMSPKISDFGIARSFGGNEIEASTTRVAGTLGYMSPEYASEGLYSTKSDVFSFGVLVLEIISGKRNRGFSHPDHDLNLLGHAWTLYIEGGFSQFIDASIMNTYNLSEVLRSINVGLLCVQRFPDDRPSMHSVVLMLGSEGTLPRPKEPCFFTDRNMMEANSSSSIQPTITQLEAR
ncbi:G-type lectin S-receptor-like serine/threonine-protein kinase At4g27290 isoform X2 [Vitis vinifera]|uniref:G-type lectin S-receptor-like serine/threonine-protein kinase At4g27290 isoform X2 n=1 Tax=Vitis vinifera TaxID=29760 RepID=UPI00053F9007|nr:G-type lectin S-receptor-like serine/threonine-protein kinase At4g27290 isoform X2 [Vitis vinifera]|eukprot:XP_010644305.1 PREDICTED: G-type lectin S-receptor-like serine/threonine-protein kinase At4g27290 isoform X2 [Vitis vinifera]